MELAFYEVAYLLVQVNRHLTLCSHSPFQPFWKVTSSQEFHLATTVQILLKIYKS